ncbi:uncharacterized protein LOC108735496 [Agrilus planipennis]|uniref:Uncharacterized protein LOC108735496 n=1 Tax=Agrilus planipennis TaxID=224129 RepID=A0A1W4WSH9_AGRPL|nr:uncharacterized protein LOC108735496 [Agrilus planipennis]XP_025837143.1 uncharacterized protein LOC108735496 [Agrilus planipennis]XP_025837144.1 uncharacterized protein LOC108735496 [Agrilus planipennis]
MSEDGYSDSYDEPAMDLVIETLTGTSFEMKVCPSDTILDIKNKIQRVEGIPVHHQNLLYRLNELKDHNRLCDMGIQSGSVLKLVLSMRGGPISTRRLSSTDQHIWKNLKELLENTREELGDKLGPGSKVSVLVFKDGDIINLIRVIENDADSLYPLGETVSSRGKQTVREDTRASFCTKLKENDEMLTKLTELRKKMSELTLKRNLRHMGCSSDTACCHELAKTQNEHQEATTSKQKATALSSSSPSRKKDKHGKKQRDSLYDISFKLLEDFDKNNEDSESPGAGSETDLVRENLQTDEDSIALKEKHRGNKSKHNFLYTNLSETRLKPDKVTSSPSPGFHCRRKSDDSTIFATENREKPNYSHHHHHAQCYKKVKLSPKSTRKEAPNLDEKVTIWSPLSPIIRRARSQEPEVPCQIDLAAAAATATSTSPTSSIAILEEEETENDDKELLSPIGFPCVGTVSMSKVPVHLVYPDRKNEKLDNCDIYPEEPKETTCRSTANCKFGLVRRRQSLDCTSRSANQPSEQSKSSLYKQSWFEEVSGDLFFPHFVPMGPSAIPSEYTPREDPLGDFCFDNYSRYLRSPLYRRQSQMSDESSTSSRGGGGGGGVKPRNLRHFSWNAELPTEKEEKLENGEEGGKEDREYVKKEVLKLPAVVAKKKIRCGLCNKRLNITNVYDCRCGGVFCSQHRYSEVHGCKFDYKTEGHKMLQKQNPLVIAEKLQKF